MLGDRRDTDISLTATRPNSPPQQSGLTKTASKTVYATEATKTYARCTRSEAQAYLKRTAADDASLLPRVFLHARGLGASARATDLLSKVRGRRPRARARRALAAPPASSPRRALVRRDADSRADSRAALRRVAAARSRAR